MDTIASLLPRNDRRREAGLTLVELMIVVAAIGILAAIALPSYSSYVLRSNRTVAKTFLTGLIAKQESFRADRKSYAGVLGVGGLGLGANNMFLERDGDAVTATNSEVIYEVSVETATPSGGPFTAFTLMAVPRNGQTRDTTCGTLRITSTGSKTATATDCWTR